MRTRLPRPAVPALVTALTAAALAVPVTAGTTGSVAAAATATRPVTYSHWDTRADFAYGTPAGVSVVKGRLVIASPQKQTRRYAGATWQQASWTSPWTTPGHTFTELVPSWEAATPKGTFVEITVRGRSGRNVSSWDTLGRWASYDTGFQRTSRGSQTDDLARVATDTFIADTSFSAFQVRVNLLRRSGTTLTPRVDAVGAMVSRIPASTSVTTSKPGVARSTALAVPAYSQMTHAGHFPQYGGGGEAWCSPTSLAMVLGYYKALPPAAQYAWVGPNHPDAVVDHVARMTYDYGYRGTGNWPFNTAYAATRVDQAFVTRFSNLRGVERFIKAGIPVIVSVTFKKGELTGAPISSTAGHLLVVRGFDAVGNVRVNDPAAKTRKGVARTYDRAQFENAWLKRGANGGSGGIAYVVRDAAHPLPARNGATNW